MSKNPVEEVFRWASDAVWRLRLLPKIQVVSDPDGSFDVVRRFMESVFRGQVSFREGEERVAGELRDVFAPGTDLGDLLLIGKNDEDALVRFVSRHPQPIHRALWKSFRREFKEGLRHQGSIANYAARHGAKIFSRGWETKKRRGPLAKKKPSRMGRKPLEKTVDLGDGTPVILREPTPTELADVLSGDTATFGDRLLRVSIVRAGGWRARSPEDEDIEVFLREYSAEELGTLLREARAFVVECVLHGRGAAFYEMNKAATDYLSGGRTRSEMVKARRSEPEIALSHDTGEGVFVGGEEILISEEPSPLDALIEREEEMELRDRLRDDRLTDRDRAIIEARENGKTFREIAVELGISHGYARNLWSMIRKKISPP